MKHNITSIAEGAVEFRVDWLCSAGGGDRGPPEAGPALSTGGKYLITVVSYEEVGCCYVGGLGICGLQTLTNHIATYDVTHDSEAPD